MRFGRRGMRMARRSARLPAGARLSVTSLQAAEDPKRFERALVFALRATHFPHFVTQLQFARPRKFSADVAFVNQRLLVEVQGAIWQAGGGGHSHPKGILRDIEKMQHAAARGWFYLPVTTDSVTDGTALIIINKALVGLGWKA